MNQPIWQLCNCKSEEEWNNLSSRAQYDRKYRRGLNNPNKIDYTPSLTKDDLQKYIKDIILTADGEVDKIILVNSREAVLYNKEKYIFFSVGHNKHLLLHRVLYAWFIGPIPKNYVVDHIDNNKHNNHLDNFQLLSRKDNVKKDYKNIKNQYS